MADSESPGIWDAFEDSAARLGDSLGFRGVKLLNWQSEYDPTTGTYGNQRLVKVRSFEAEVRQPTQPRTVTDADGGDSEVDVEIFVDVGDINTGELVETGEEERASVIEDTTDNSRFSVAEAFDENNGLVRISAVER